MGDEVIFIYKKERLLTKVTGLFVASSFELLLKKVGGVKAGWKKKESMEQMLGDLRKFYSETEENEWGVVGIGVEMCK